MIGVACTPQKQLIDHKPSNVKPKPSESSPNKSAKIDTVHWKDVTKTDPKTTGTNPAENKTNSTEKKPDEKVVVAEKMIGFPSLKKQYKSSNSLDILALIPFKTNEFDSLQNKLPSGSQRFIQFYAGAKMAIEEMKLEGGKKVKLQVLDAQSKDPANDILPNMEAIAPHVIIGPYKAEHLKSCAEWAKRNETILISPWISSSTIADDNPFYIQAKAGLTSHYKAINDHARANFNIKNIILVSKTQEDSKGRYFNDTTLYSQRITEKTISEDDLSNSQNPVLTPILLNEGPTVFILPLGSSKDENYIYQFLRRVSLEKGTKEVIVYGMYKWIELKSDILDYINTQKIRLSISNYFDPESAEVRSFKKKYFNEYREFPSEEALEGYDLMKYVIRGSRNGEHPFHWNKSLPNYNYLETQFQIAPVYKTKKKQEAEAADYFENSFVKIVEIRSNRYRVLD